MLNGVAQVPQGVNVCLDGSAIIFHGVFAVQYAQDCLLCQAVFFIGIFPENF